MRVVIYVKPNCPYCDQAKRLLTANAVEYTEVHFDVGQPRLSEAVYVDVAEFKQQHPDAKTAPQVFIDDVRIGGHAELVKFFEAAA